MPESKYLSRGVSWRQAAGNKAENFRVPPVILNKQCLLRMAGQSDLTSSVEMFE
ncbi:MAG: hypothetical protein O9332_04460 [Microcystis sp. LE19-10.1B]|uniref:hypothetical protein n=1 Tax=Microcystis sp. LE19-10.1B TaxID=3016428 RepID=UPI0022C5E7F0|nr:hypothetical protein [Microcystis sp. LE19-10.1B]MCZ8024722.1 hypothetical protein [Microcystis sp. LE19-10.1B]